MTVLREGFKATKNFVLNAPGLKPLNPQPYGVQVGVSTDAEIDTFNRAYA